MTEVQIALAIVWVVCSAITLTSLGYAKHKDTDLGVIALAIALSPIFVWMVLGEVLRNRADAKAKQPVENPADPC